ncbi:MAG: hypothetical protein KC464_03000, partial [Myxococcales bacterium]|nr:hypothetical protein [Myxococcales bacterium]
MPDEEPQDPAEPPLDDLEDDTVGQDAPPGAVDDEPEHTAIAAPAAMRRTSGVLDALPDGDPEAAGDVAAVAAVDSGPVI